MIYNSDYQDVLQDEPATSSTREFSVVQFSILNQTCLRKERFRKAFQIFQKHNTKSTVVTHPSLQQISLVSLFKVKVLRVCLSLSTQQPLTHTYPNQSTQWVFPPTFQWDFIIKYYQKISMNLLLKITCVTTDERVKTMHDTESYK